MPEESATAPSRIEVRVLFFARAQDLAGTPRASLSLAAPATLASVRAALMERFPRLETCLEFCRFAINQEFADLESAVPNLCELAVIPPVSGG